LTEEQQQQHEEKNNLIIITEKKNKRKLCKHKTFKARKLPTTQHPTHNKFKNKTTIKISWKIIIIILYLKNRKNKNYKNSIL